MSEIKYFGDLMDVVESPSKNMIFSGLKDGVVFTNVDKSYLSTFLQHTVILSAYLIKGDVGYYTWDEICKKFSKPNKIIKFYKKNKDYGDIDILGVIDDPDVISDLNASRFVYFNYASAKPSNCSIGRFTYKGLISDLLKLFKDCCVDKSANLNKNIGLFHDVTADVLKIPNNRLYYIEF